NSNAYGGETCRDSAAHWRPVGKRPIAAGYAFCTENGFCCWRLFLLFRFIFFFWGAKEENENWT
ncbi:MAG: hypothetical protein MJA30_13730, partial [Cytophagales bacterium]|nr:hypothetical protein [Cytophagales bacterium]